MGSYVAGATKSTKPISMTRKTLVISPDSHVKIKTLAAKNQITVDKLANAMISFFESKLNAGEITMDELRSSMTYTGDIIAEK